MNPPPLYPCPCCGVRTVSERGAYEICEVCGWEDDPGQRRNPFFRGGANEESLHDARRRWKRKEKRENR